MPLPEWMTPDISYSGEPTQATALRPGRARRRSIVRRAMSGFGRLISDLASAEAAGHFSGLPHKVDARIKVVGILGLIIVMTLVHSLPALALGLIICITCALVSRIPVRRFAGAWLFVPLFSIFIMLPAALNVVTPGNAVWTVYHFSSDHIGPWQLPAFLAITDAGLLVAGRVVLRATACVSFAVMLTSTTAPTALFRGLRGLGVPQIFVVILSMMHRYLVVLARAAEEMHLAKLSRSIHQGGTRREQAWVASGMGSLFRRTYALSQAVYLAMVSRGYTGEVYLLDEPRPGTRDWLFLAGCILTAAALLVIG